MRPILLLPLSLLAAACSGRVLDVGSSSGQSAAGSSGSSGGSSTSPGSSGGPNTAGPGGPQAGIVGGSGYFTVLSDQGAATGSYSASVVFTSDFISPDSIKSINGCEMNPYYIEPKNDHSGVVGAPRPQAGEVSITGGNLALRFDADSSGTYPDHSGPSPAWKGGEGVTISWLGSGASQGLQSGLSHTLAAPMYASLATDSAFATAANTVSRINDIQVKWQYDATPAADDRIVVDLRIPGANGQASRALCMFDAPGGQGLIPANVLETLGPGTGTYAVTSEHDFAVVTNDWHLNYTLASHVRTSDGLATGSFTIQ
jgi:hypothetical protein